MMIREQNVKGGHVQNIGLQQNFCEAVTFQQYISSLRQNWLPIQSGFYYYRSELTPFFGRETELEYLKRFLKQPEKFLLFAVTGNGGSGKSRLVYEFLKQSEGWDGGYLNWKEFSESSLNQTIYDFSYENDLILVLDYVLGYADEIGDWLYKVKNHIATVKKRIRIIIIEREGVDSCSAPYWYAKIIAQNRLEGILYQIIDLKPLSNYHLIEIARAVIRRRTPNIYVKDETILDNIIQPLTNIDPDKKRTIFLLYITDAWIGNNDVKSWDEQELLNWINGNELRRIRDLMCQDVSAAESILNLLCYATAVSGLDGENIPEFLEKDFEIIVRFSKEKRTNLVQLFNEINIEPSKTIYLEPMIPDLMGEYFCIHFLMKEKLNNYDKSFFSSFVKSAIVNHTNEYSAFLVRISQDFTDTEFTGLIFYLYDCDPTEVPISLYGKFLLNQVRNLQNPFYQITLNQVLEKIIPLIPAVKAGDIINAYMENLLYLTAQLVVPVARRPVRACIMGCPLGIPFHISF